jgi:prepilin-type N-terminal cleavage/methylation domain-containing protein
MKKGFSLIELLVVISILAVIIAVAIPNFLSARQRGSDTKKKDEINQLKYALRLYYNDYQIYPANGNDGIGYINYIFGCGVNGTSSCKSTCTGSFAAGGTGCDTVYMKQFPSDLGSSMYYYQRSSGDDFCLKVGLDNASDPDLDKSQSRCATSCGSYCDTSSSSVDYCACSD